MPGDSSGWSAKIRSKPNSREDGVRECTQVGRQQDEDDDVGESKRLTVVV